MINQIEFEGYLSRIWEHRQQTYLRLANHRPEGNGSIDSDYVTVRVDPGLDFDPRRVHVGQLIRVHGRIHGRDIVEPLKAVVAKSHREVELPGELATLVIRRPTVQILATLVQPGRAANHRRKKDGHLVHGTPQPSPLPEVPVEAGQDLAEILKKR